MRSRRAQVGVYRSHPGTPSSLERHNETLIPLGRAVQP
jgi:hypothetical protein